MNENSNKKTLTLIRTFWPILILVLGVVGTAGVNVYRIGDNDARIKVNHAEIVKGCEIEQKNQITAAELKKDVLYIKQTIDKQAVDVDNNRILLEEILDKVTE